MQEFRNARSLSMPCHYCPSRVYPGHGYYVDKDLQTVCESCFKKFNWKSILKYENFMIIHDNPNKDALYCGKLANDFLFASLKDKSLHAELILCGEFSLWGVLYKNKINEWNIIGSFDNLKEVEDYILAGNWPEEWCPFVFEQDIWKKE